ncbi:hypothetical protein [Glycomyces artemisiae]|uniref:Uncharacterized protein n=1 Tax=Glycomyces artemisiae TaxID=1076443 RepID=A0A2T0UEX3_9ACTN|nr:hypothetical protein [Glycomyces artemisiae]PRY56398.1 hypothetical protein B0I28_10947 [Glycomyces artemisiae]
MTSVVEELADPPGRVFMATWRTGPADAIITVQVWGRRERRDALLRFRHDGGHIDAGTLSGGGTDDAAVVWTDKAKEAYAEDWLDTQEREAIKALSIRWGTV